MVSSAQAGGDTLLDRVLEPSSLSTGTPAGGVAVLDPAKASVRVFGPGGELESDWPMPLGEPERVVQIAYSHGRLALVYERRVELWVHSKPEPQAVIALSASPSRIYAIDSGWVIVSVVRGAPPQVDVLAPGGDVLRRIAFSKGAWKPAEESLGPGFGPWALRVASAGGRILGSPGFGGIIWDLGTAGQPAFQPLAWLPPENTPTSRSLRGSEAASYIRGMAARASGESRTALEELAADAEAGMPVRWYVSGVQQLAGFGRYLLVETSPEEARAETACRLEIWDVKNHTYAWGKTLAVACPVAVALGGEGVWLPLGDTWHRIDWRRRDANNTIQGKGE